MSHRFDSGLTKPLRQFLLDGVIAALSPLLRANGGYVASIRHLAAGVKGPHDADTIGLVWDVLQGQTPAIGVSISDASYDAAGIGGYSYAEILDVHVYMLINSIRSREERKTGDVVSRADDHADPGAFVLHEHILELLTGAMIGQIPNWGITPDRPTPHLLKDLRPSRFEELDNDNGMLLSQMVFFCKLSREINPDRNVTQLLNEIHTYGRIADQSANVVIEQNTEMDDP